MISKAIGIYQILNVTHALDCLDESRSEVTLWQPGDLRPDRVGSIKMIWTLRVDPNRTNEHHIVRLAKWRIAMLVSNTLKAALSEIPNLGVRFEPAS